MEKDGLDDLFSKAILENLFPKERTDQFFDALFGEPSEGAFDISLQFKGYDREKLLFEFHLKERSGKCLACNLTSGLPEVFTRHPVINVKGLIQGIDKLLNGRARCASWQLGYTREISGELHIIPLAISLKE